MSEKTDRELTQEEKEDLWLELGPASAYTGLACHDTAIENGDASPDAERLGWEGAEPGTGPNSLAVPPDDLDPELHALEWLDDTPPIDR